MLTNFNWRIFLCSFLLFLFVVFQGKTQAIKRQSINSYGTSTFYKKVLIRQTIGQPYSTVTYYSNETGCRPGFQQPNTLKIEAISSTLDYINLDVYPNPAVYSVTIKSSETIYDAILQVVDINGKLILKKEIHEMETYNIDCDSWTNGTYIITLLDNKKNKISYKLIKK